MATQGERLDALEKENEELKGAVAALTEKVEKLSQFARAADESLKELEEVTAGHGRTLAEGTAHLMDGELIAGELVEGCDPRGEVLKAFRQIEAIANHINVKLPA